MGFNVYFSQHTGKKPSREYTTTYYNCQHDGHEKPHRKQGEVDRLTNKRYKRGQVKKGDFCQARMTTKVFRDGKTEVTYIKSHNHAKGSRIRNTNQYPSQ